MKFFIYPYEHIPESHHAGLVHANKAHKIFIDTIKSYSAKEADYFIVPIKIKTKTGLAIRSILLPHLYHYDVFPQKHIFFLTADNPPESLTKTLAQSILFKNSVAKLDKNSYSLHYNPIVHPEKLTSILSCQYDLGFMGAFDGDLRQKIPKICSSLSFKVFIKEHKFWHSTRESNQIAKTEYNQVMQNSKFILCPKGNALNSIRFFEALCFGRIPILLSDDVRLPLENKIKYEDFILRIPEAKFDNLNNYLKNYMKSNDIEKQSIKCRKIWENYFSETSFEFFLKQSLLEKNIMHIPLI